MKYIVSSLLVGCLWNASAQQSPVVVDKIIAKVDDYIVLKSDLEKAYLEYLSRGQFRSANAKCQILEQLVVSKMMVAKAEIDSVEVSEEEARYELRRRMDMMISQIGSREEVEKAYGKTVRQLEEELYDGIKENLTVQRMQQEITAEVKVSPAEVKRFFNMIPRDSLPYFSKEVEVAVIVKEAEPGKKQKDEVKRLMYELRGRIIAGESFADLARQYSEDPGSAARGGELPFYSRGELAPEFEATAMTMSEGELSMPVETQFGYHLIELQQRRGNTFKTRHILVSPKPDLADFEKAHRFLDSLRTMIVLDSIDFQSAAKEYSDDKLTSSNGGFFEDQDGGIRISVDQLDPNIFFTIDTMKVGSISTVDRFQLPDGSSAFRIIYYKSSVPPHMANLKDDYQKIANAALNNKQNQILSEWFEEARSKVYIEIDPEYESCNLLE